MIFRPLAISNSHVINAGSERSAAPGEVRGNRILEWMDWPQHLQRKDRHAVRIVAAAFLKVPHRAVLFPETEFLKEIFPKALGQATIRTRVAVFEATCSRGESVRASGLKDYTPDAKANRGRAPDRAKRCKMCAGDATA